MTRLVTQLALGLLSLSGLPAVRASSPSTGNAVTSTDSAMAMVLAAFRTHPIVILGMDHRLLSEMVFARALVTSPEFPAVANDVVIECANAKYQALLDSYIAGDDVPLKQLSIVWRNSTQTGRCDGADGPDLLAAIRERNRVLPSSRRIRVLAPDPRIDWDRVQSPTDYARFIDARDTSIVGTVEREVLARGRKAFLIIGAGHVLRRPITFGDVGARVTTVSQDLERNHPGSTYVIMTHSGFGTRTREYESRMSHWTRPTLVDLARMWPGDEPAGLVYTGAVMRVGQDPCRPRDPYPGSRLRDLADAFLYLGPMDSLEFVSPPSYSADDSTYLREVDRRRTVSGEGSASVASLPPAPGRSSAAERAPAPTGARSLAGPCTPAGLAPRRPGSDSPPRRIPSGASLNGYVARPSLN